jgi:hypothetical protein
MAAVLARGGDPPETPRGWGGSLPPQTPLTRG